MLRKERTPVFEGDVVLVIVTMFGSDRSQTSDSIHINAQVQSGHCIVLLSSHLGLGPTYNRACLIRTLVDLFRRGTHSRPPSSSLSCRGAVFVTGLHFARYRTGKEPESPGRTELSVWPPINLWQKWESNGRLAKSKVRKYITALLERPSRNC